MRERYHIGNAKREAPEYRGWLCGVFVEEGSARHRPEMEIKYSEFVEGGVTDHPTKVSSIAEVTMVLSGVVCGHINDEPFVMEAGDYIAIAPGQINNTVIIAGENTTLLTVKAPSDPSAKVVVEGA